MANLFAAGDPDPAFLDDTEESLRESGEFADVWRPAPGWVAAQAPLPESAPDGEIARSHGFVFAEGRDRLEDGRGPDWVERVEELTGRSPGRLGELPGDFGFLRVRPDGTALAVRSCTGLAPLYLHRRSNGGVVLGTLLNYFPRFLARRFRVDPLINAAYTACGQFIEGRTFVEDVSILPPASYTKLTPGRIPETGIYWDPRPQEGDEPSPDPEHPRQLRAILIETLERDLDPAGRNLVTMSGGIDSSSVAALAGRTVGRQLSSFSLIPPKDPQRAHELSYIEPLAAEVGIRPIHKCELTVERLAQWVLESPGLPFQVTHPVLCELPRIYAKQEVRVLVGGEFADELCGQWLRITDWARYTSLWQLLAHPRSLPFGPRDYLRWTRRRLRDAIGRPVVSVPSRPRRWANATVDAEYQEWLMAYRAAVARDRRPLKELAGHRDINAWLTMQWEATTSLGVRRSLPFFNREALDLAFACHPRELLGPGPKRLLRAALRDDVPARNLYRQDKGGWPSDSTVSRELMRRVFTGAPPDQEGLAAAATFARPDWLPTPPTDVEYVDACNLHSTMRIASYLANQTDQQAAPVSARLRPRR